MYLVYHYVYDFNKKYFLKHGQIISKIVTCRLYFYQGPLTHTYEEHPFFSAIPSCFNDTECNVDRKLKVIIMSLKIIWCNVNELQSCLQCRLLIYLQLD